MTTNLVLTRRSFLPGILAFPVSLGFVRWAEAGGESKLELTITGPKEGDTITTVKGRAKGFPTKGIRLRAVVLPKGDIFYSQTGPRTKFARVAKDGTFEIKVQLGRGGRDYGQRFTVVVFAYEDEMEKKLPRFDESHVRVSSEDDLRDKLLPFLYKKSKHAISKGQKITKVKK